MCPLWKLPAVALARLRGTFLALLRTVAVIALPAVLQGCWAPPTALVAGADPADPSARVAPVRYRSVTEPYSSRRPVEPGSWREQNERLIPPPKN